MKSILYGLALSSFWFMSPESLVIAGNSAGVGGGLSLLLLVYFGVVVYLGIEAITVKEKLLVSKKGDKPSSENDAIIILGIAGIVGTTLFGATGMLVTAGFTFNEVFFYRFPNFAFAYLLLVFAILVINISSSLREIFTIIVTLLCVTGLLVLTGIGFSGESNTHFRFINKSLLPSDLMSLLLVFIGLEKVAISQKFDSKKLKTCLALLICVLGCWMLVSSMAVEQSRLANSSIPYMIAASKIGSEIGRKIMGAVIIMASLSAVYVLLTIASD